MRIISRFTTLLVAAGFGAAAILMSTDAVMAASASDAEVTINAANGADGKAMVGNIDHSYAMNRLDKRQSE